MKADRHSKAGTIGKVSALNTSWFNNPGTYGAKAGGSPGIGGQPGLQSKF